MSEQRREAREVVVMAMSNWISCDEEIVEQDRADFIATCEALILADARPTSDVVAPLIGWFYGQPGNACGGTLHIVTDDYNISDANVSWAINWAQERGDVLGMALGLVLLRMKRTARLKACRGDRA